MSYSYEQTPEIEEWFELNPIGDDHCRTYERMNVTQRDLDGLLKFLDDNPSNFHPCSWCEYKHAIWLKEFKKNFKVTELNTEDGK